MNAQAGVEYATGPGLPYTTLIVGALLFWLIVTGRLEAAIRVITGPKDTDTQAKTDSKKGGGLKPFYAPSYYGAALLRG